MSCQLEWIGVATWWCQLGPSGQAAWVQSIGSVAAIAIAIAIPYWQRSRQIRDKSERDRKVVMSAAANLKIALDYEAQVFDWAPAGDGDVVHNFTLDQAREFMLLRPQTREALHLAIEKSHYFKEDVCECIVKLGIKAAAYERMVGDLARRAEGGNPDAFFRSVSNTNQKLLEEIEALREKLKCYLPKEES